MAIGAMARSVKKVKDPNRIVRYRALRVNEAQRARVRVARSVQRARVKASLEYAAKIKRWAGQPGCIVVARLLSCWASLVVKMPRHVGTKGGADAISAVLSKTPKWRRPLTGKQRAAADRLRRQGGLCFNAPNSCYFRPTRQGGG
jgi:hypothetical protein